MNVLGLVSHASLRTGYGPNTMCKRDDRDGFVFFGSTDEASNDFVIP